MKPTGASDSNGVLWNNRAYIMLQNTINRLGQSWDDLHFALDRFYASENFETNLVLVLLLSCLSCVLIYTLCRRREVLIPTMQPSTRPRFRKRDKVRYYARKILRKSQQVVDQARKPPQNRQEFIKLAKSMLRIRQKSKKLVPKDPPAAILEADLSSNDSESRLPTEYVYLLRNVQVFGHLEKPVYLEICKSMQVLSYRANQIIFNIGDMDDSIFVVTEGQVNVYINDSNGDEILLKEVEPGDSVHSLLSILDVLTGHPAPYKTVFARAEQECTILKLPGQAFEKVFDEFPESMLRVVQVIMVRLIRVTFWALHNYLGLDHQLVKPRGDSATLEKLSPRGIKTLDTEYNDLISAATIESDLKLIDLCKRDLAKIFNIEDESLFDDKLSICHYKTDSYLYRQGDPDADVIFIIKGRLLMTQKMVDKEKETLMFSSGPGEIVGLLATLSGEPSIFSVKTSEPTVVAHINKLSFYELVRSQPRIVLDAADMFVRRLSPFVRQIDFALDWNHIESGRALYKAGDKSDSLYIILNGRIRTVVEYSEGKKYISGEYGKGELIGIAEVITHTDRSTTAIAVRDTELAQVPAQLLEHIRHLYPEIITRLYHLLGNRLMGMQSRIEEENLLKENPSVDPRSTISNISTVCIVPASNNVPLTAFALELQQSLRSICPSLRLTSDIINDKLGPWAHDRPNEYRLSSWLAAQEDTYRIVLYQCDYQFTPWTKRCIRQSDVILIVAVAEESPHPGSLEQALEKMSIRSQKELILLHRKDASHPSNTVDWLNAREWCLSHHHIRCPNRVFSKHSMERMLSLYQRMMESKPDPNSDMSRLARFLTGTAIGLVLGGGGAKGAAQIGFIKAMTEYGIPIDMVGGTSIGSFVGALWCDERNVTRVIHRARQWFKSMTSFWSKLLDLTYPIASMMTGYSFNRSIEDVFRDTQIEDLWIPYFNITTDITASKMRVHTSGDLWRYVRSSMSLSGYLPPLCDPKDGHLLLDGGYVNNLPADVMKAAGASIIFAVDVGAHEDRNYTNYGDHLSGFWLLWKKWNPWAEPVRVPGIEEIQSHLAYISCVKNMEHITKMGICEYVRPPIDKYQTLQFNSFEEILECGYNFAKPYFAALVQTERLKSIVKPSDTLLQRQHSKQETNSYTDLANIMNEYKTRATRSSSYDLANALSSFVFQTDTEYEDGEEGENGQQGIYENADDDINDDIDDPSDDGNDDVDDDADDPSDDMDSFSDEDENDHLSASNMTDDSPRLEEEKNTL